MNELLQLLRQNRNYRYTGRADVSEIGDRLNNIAVFALAMALTHSGMVVTGVLLARAIPAITIGPLAGVLLDRFDHKRIMIASDLIRALIALGFIFAATSQLIWVLYAFSALLSAASPFFTAGRSAILLTIPVLKKSIRQIPSPRPRSGWRLQLGLFFAHRNCSRVQIGIRRSTRCPL